MAGAYVSIHCDGSTLGNPGPSGYGAVLRWKGHTKKIHGHLGKGTNNRAELLAVLHALDHLKKEGLHITVYSDSQYVVKGARREWKIETNLDLWKQLKMTVARHQDVIFNWIPREQNSEADALANRGRQNYG